MTVQKVLGAYTVVPRRVLAGAFPDQPDVDLQKEHLRQLLAWGARVFLNLTEETEEARRRRSFDPYSAQVPELAAELGIGVSCTRVPMRDERPATREAMDRAQRVIEAAEAAGRGVYIHCFAGQGRTGQVVGVYLIRRGLALPADFDFVVGDLRERANLVAGPSMSAEQLAFVRRYVADRPG